MTHSLYRHWDANRRLLYVGISLNAFNRLAQHRNTARWFDRIRSVTIQNFETKDEASAAEWYAIITEYPIYNLAMSHRLELDKSPDGVMWGQMIDDEPELWDLFVKVHKIKEEDDAESPFCANRVWYREIKPQLSRLIGWDAKNPKVKDDRCYDAAYHTLYRLLPNCRDCEAVEA